MPGPADVVTPSEVEKAARAYEEKYADSLPYSLRARNIFAGAIITSARLDLTLPGRRPPRGALHRLLFPARVPPGLDAEPDQVHGPSQLEHEEGDRVECRLRKVSRPR